MIKHCSVVTVLESPQQWGQRQRPQFFLILHLGDLQMMPDTYIHAYIHIMPLRTLHYSYITVH